MSTLPIERNETSLATGTAAAATNIAVTVTVLLAGTAVWLGFKKITIHDVLNFTYPHWS